MSLIVIALATLALLLALTLLRLPIALALLIAGTAGYAWVDGWTRALSTVASVPAELIKSYGLSVVPMFVLMGAVAARSGLSSDLYEAAKAMARRGARGTLATATIGACALFGAICGSSLATAATMTRIAVPEMRANGYSDQLAAGSVAAGGTLGILIPPSVILVIYALLAEESVPALFAGALIPGILLTVFCILVVKFLVWRHPHWGPPVRRDYARGERLRIALRTWKVLGVFALSIGGIYLGWFSPTEAAAIGAGAVIVIGVADRRIGLAELRDSIRETVITSASLFFVFLCAVVYARFIALTRLPNELVDLVQAWALPAPVVVAIIVLVYLLLGCILETVSMVLITVPVFLPLMLSLGYDPIWFGVLVVVAAEMGLITPPVGMNLFVIRSQVPDIPLTRIISGALPFLWAQVGLIVVMVAVPGITAWLPALIAR